MNRIDLQHVPFSAYSLIEASAGTGKTYTISQLVLRLVLLGRNNHEALSVEQILVVTFTKAATQELKDRIRANLVVALKLIQQWEKEGLLTSPLCSDNLPDELNGVKNDPFKAIVLDALVLHSSVRCQSLLQIAIFKMDEAPIFTIHSFCQRMLGEYALLAGKPLQQDLVEQSKPVIIELAQIFWRDTVYQLNADQTQLVLSQFKTPRDLVDQLAHYLNEDLVDHVIFPDRESFNQACQLASDTYAQAQLCWTNDEAEIRALFDVKGLGASYKVNHLAARFEALSSYLLSGSAVSGLLGTLTKNKALYFLSSVLDEKCKLPIQHPLFEYLEKLSVMQEELQLGLLSFCRLSLQDSLADYKRQNNICFFDDLIKQFSEVLTHDGDSAAHLQQVIRERFPLALIDEFQDTDKQQFQIFDAIYQRQASSALMMIGDPKQAIYSFRGADIQTYFSARDCVEPEQQYTLDINWRSLPSLVSAVNTIFSQHDKAFVQENFPAYPQVNSPSDFDGWQGLMVSDEQGNEHEAAISVFNQFEHQLNKKDGTEYVANQTAEFLAQLLAKGSRINGRSIEPKDIAILVRKSSQAKVMQAALLAQGLNSIFLSKETVLECDDVPAFIRLIKACVSPFDHSAVLGALGDSLIAYDLEAIKSLNDDPERLFILQDSFSDAKLLSQSKGFIVMWQWLLNHFDIAKQLLAKPHGERRLTNINQLAEIVHAQIPAFDLEQQLQAFIDVYLQCTQGDGDDSHSQKMRLDSEANLIEIVTIHGSKGLEYPMVCCPFVSESDAVRSGFNQLYNDATSTYDMVWKASVQQTKQLANDQLAEDVRLLYVAFTRAKYHLNLSWQPFKGVENTPLWHLISAGNLPAIKNSSADEFKHFFEQLSHCVVNPVASDIWAAAGNDGKEKTWQLKSLSRQFYEPAVARSYSALLKSHGSAVSNVGEDDWSDNAEQGLARDEGIDGALVEPEEDFDCHALNMFNFPRGAHPGNFLHLVYEEIDFQDSMSFLTCIERLSQQYLIDEKWHSCLVEHTQQFMQKELAPLSVALADLSSLQVKKEMGFHLMAKKTQGHEISNILSQYRGDERAVSFNNIEGLFKGFIDLIFEHEGKFYVLDYKSNHLGLSFSDYHQDAMHEAMLGHHYDLQYLVYTCALHLYLQQRIKNYSYEKHIGGVFYIFLRGINDEDNAGIYYQRPSLSIINRLVNCFEVGDVSGSHNQNHSQ